MNPFLAVIGRKLAGGGGGGGGTPDLINEDFEGSGTPSGWYGGGGADYDYTATPLAGSQSCRCVAAGNTFAAYNGAFNVSELWFKLTFKAESIGGGTQQIIAINDGTSNIYIVYLETTGILTLTGTVQVSSTVSTVAAGTVYNIWGHYHKVGVGSSILEVSFDTVGGSRPNSGNKYAGVTDGVYNTNATGWGMGCPNASGALVNTVWDDVKVASTDVF